MTCSAESKHPKEPKPTCRRQLPLPQWLWWTCAEGGGGDKHSGKASASVGELPEMKRAPLPLRWLCQRHRRHHRHLMPKGVTSAVIIVLTQLQRNPPSSTSQDSSSSSSNWVAGQSCSTCLQVKGKSRMVGIHDRKSFERAASTSCAKHSAGSASQAIQSTFACKALAKTNASANHRYHLQMSGFMLRCAKTGKRQPLQAVRMSGCML